MLKYLFIFCFSITLFCQNIGINATGALPNSNAILDIDALPSNPKGVLLPRLTTSQRDAISGTIPESLLIYNTTSQCFEAYNAVSSTWVAFGCIGCDLADVVVVTSASSITSTSFTANWNVSAGATGYFLDVSSSSDFSSFVIGYSNLSVNGTSVNVTGLSAGVTYYYRIRAMNSCGTSDVSNVISVTTNMPPLSIGCNTSQTESDYGTTNSVPGSTKTWITRNLGATTQATSETDNSDAAAGCYFQFNRVQAYGFDNGGTLNPTWTISSINENSNWTATTGANADPCVAQLGGSWRLPTYTEWNTVFTTAGFTTALSGYNSVLKLHMSGFLSQGNIMYRGVYGFFYSSTQITTNMGWSLRFQGNYVVGATMKFDAISVRCLK